MLNMCGNLKKIHQYVFELHCSQRKKQKDERTDKSQQLENFQGGWREGRGNYVWMPSHTTIASLPTL